MLLKPGQALYMAGRDGMLIYRRRSFDRMRASLHDLHEGDEQFALENARVLKVGHGGILIAGDEMHFAGIKSKGEARPQSWWCVPLTKVVLPKDEPLAAPPD